MKLTNDQAKEGIGVIICKFQLWCVVNTTQMQMNSNGWKMKLPHLGTKPALPAESWFFIDLNYFPFVSPTLQLKHKNNVTYTYLNFTACRVRYVMSNRRNKSSINPISFVQPWYHAILMLHLRHAMYMGGSAALKWIDFHFLPEHARILTTPINRIWTGTSSWRFLAECTVDDTGRKAAHRWTSHWTSSVDSPAWCRLSENDRRSTERMRGVSEDKQQ